VNAGNEVSAEMLLAVERAQEAIRAILAALPNEDAADGLDILRDRILAMLAELVSPET
jgi:hypothetical protein